MRDAIITLTSDFGAGNAYVASMKGVILSINPRATIVDICHSIQPQNIPQAAFILSSTHHYFPQGTIHLVIVDPGVGTKRRAILLITPSAFFLAPDNGVLSYIVGPSQEKQAYPSQASLYQPQQRELASGFQAISLTNSSFWHHPVSPTFHGRDIFAPVAAHLSMDIPPQQLGESISSILVFPLPQPHMETDGTIAGHVLHIDHFGNLITNIKSEDIPNEKVSINIAGHLIQGVAPTYADGDELLALIGSSGNLEIAIRGENAAASLGAKIGAVIKVWM